MAPAFTTALMHEAKAVERVVRRVGATLHSRLGAFHHENSALVRQTLLSAMLQGEDGPEVLACTFKLVAELSALREHVERYRLLLHQQREQRKRQLQQHELELALRSKVPLDVPQHPTPQPPPHPPASPPDTTTATRLARQGREALLPVVAPLLKAETVTRANHLVQQAYSASRERLSHSVSRNQERLPVLKDMGSTGLRLGKAAGKLGMLVLKHKSKEKAEEWRERYRAWASQQQLVLQQHQQQQAHGASGGAAPKQHRPPFASKRDFEQPSIDEHYQAAAARNNSGLSSSSSVTSWLPSLVTRKLQARL